ncbi:unnamed protein product, partial [Ectocarpus sp. 12 AP-2014]
PPPELDPKFHGFEERDMDRKLHLNSTASGGNTGYLEELGRQPTVTLRQLLKTLKRTYCGTM